MKKLILKIIVLFLLFLLPQPVFAQGNKFGIHISEVSDLEKAAFLVNSSGGDWGYVTIVIRDDDLNFQKWQDFMDKCREKHLIPLVRIATHQEGANWASPKVSDASNWANFLNSLNWPIKDRYVIIFNEPNHAKEWGGKINPEEYAEILSEYIKEFKKVNENFKILNAGFDLAASNTKSTMDALLFWRRMEKKIPGIFNQLDFWASHSYPNHGFRGKPTDTGRFSIRGYQWELLNLKKYFNLKKDLPVFITETGWLNDNNPDYFKIAYEDLWLKDERIIAVTPFILNYPEYPFAEFSWLDKNGNAYPQYEVIRSLPKKSWWPIQEEKYTLGNPILPPFMLTESYFRGRIPIKNTGQSILGEKEKFSIPPINFGENISVSPLFLSQNLKPQEEDFLEFEIKTSSSTGEFTVGWHEVGEYKIKVFLPSLVKKVEISFWEKIIFNLKNFAFEAKRFFKQI
jgi:hypothetical protein